MSIELGLSVIDDFLRIPDANHTGTGYNTNAQKHDMNM
jgi:hypothetical protein